MRSKRVVPFWTTIVRLFAPHNQAVFVKPHYSMGTGGLPVSYLRCHMALTKLYSHVALAVVAQI